MAKRLPLESILGPIRIFLNVFGIEFGAKKKDLSAEFSRQIRSLYKLLWLLISMQYALYTLTHLAFPVLVSSFLNSVKGVRSQMNSVAAFLGHFNRICTIITCHCMLLFNLEKVTNIFISVNTFLADTNWRRFSILGIVGISLSVGLYITYNLA